jgi:hypothetical protein
MRASLCLQAAVWTATLGLVLLTCVFVARDAHGEAASVADDLAVSADQFWTFDFGAPPRIPHAGDADGDGRSDLLSLWPRGGCVIDVDLTSPLGKPVLGTPGFGGFGQDGLAVAFGAFADRNTAEVLAIFADGSVRVAWGAQRTGSIYTHNDEVARVSVDQLPKKPLTAVAGDFTGDGQTDVCVIGAGGTMFVLENARTRDGPPRLTSRFVQGTLGNVRRIAAGRLGDDKAASLVWLDDAGDVYRAGLKFGSEVQRASRRRND